MFVKIRGKQIHDYQILNRHIGEKIQEQNLDIDFASHWADILEQKKVVDYVQVDNFTAVGAEIDLSAILPADTLISDGTTKGVIVEAPLNKCVVRDGISGKPILGPENDEVFGRLVAEDGEEGRVFKLKLFSIVDGEETPFELTEEQVIDFQYAERFSLATVSELFAANEKFVDGAVDVTTKLNLKQLARDLYGSGYSLDRDGDANLEKSIVDQLADEVSARTAADEALQTALDDEISRATAAEQALGTRVTAVENEIADARDEADSLAARLAGLEDSGAASGQEIADARRSDRYGEFATLDERLEAAEAALADAVAAEETRAKAAEEALDGKLVELETTLNDTIVDKLQPVEAELAAVKGEVEEARGAQETRHLVSMSL